EKAVVTGRVHVSPDDLAPVVDGGCLGAAGACQRIVDGRVSAAAQEEAVVAAAGIVTADDLSHVVDAEGQGIVLVGQGISDRGVSASTQQEAVEAVGAGGRRIETYDVTRGVDAECLGELESQGIVQGREGLDWHGAASWGRLAC